MLFSLGAFDIIVGAVKANTILNISTYGFVFMSWYMRETTVALLVVNLPLIWNLMTELSPKLKNWAGARQQTPPTFQKRPESKISTIGVSLSRLASKASWYSGSSTMKSPLASSNSWKSPLSPIIISAESDGWPCADGHHPITHVVEAFARQSAIDNENLRMGSQAYADPEKALRSDERPQIDGVEIVVQVSREKEKELELRDCSRKEKDGDC